MATNLVDLRADTAATVRILRELPKAMRKGAIRNALRKAGRVVRDAGRRAAPLLDLRKRRSLLALQRGLRKVGTVRRAIAVRTSKLSTRAGNVGVFVNVKPLKGGGARNPNDPYYWRWQEFGWNPAGRLTGGSGAKGRKVRRALAKAGSAKRQPGRFFMRAAAGQLQEALRVFEQDLAPQVQRFQSRAAR